MRRPLEWIAAWRATFEHFQLALHHAVARYQRVDSALLPHDGLTELLQRALEVSKLDLDGLQAMRFGHGRVVSTNCGNAIYQLFDGLQPLCSDNGRHGIS